MKTFCLFGFCLNGLELVTYVLIPTAMVSMVIVYLISNMKLIKISFEYNNEILNKLDDNSKILNKINEDLKIINKSDNNLKILNKIDDDFKIINKSDDNLKILKEKV